MQAIIFSVYDDNSGRCKVCNGDTLWGNAPHKLGCEFALTFIDDSGKLWFWKRDDGSLSIEWISRDVRWGLTLERNLSESGWHYVTRNVLQGDELTAGLVEALRHHLITTAMPDVAIGGYQPTHGELDSSNPPQGGSGVPPKVLVVRIE